MCCLMALSWSFWSCRLARCAALGVLAVCCWRQERKSLSSAACLWPKEQPSGAVRCTRRAGCLLLAAGEEELEPSSLPVAQRANSLPTEFLTCLLCLSNQCRTTSPVAAQAPPIGVRSQKGQPVVIWQSSAMALMSGSWLIAGGCGRAAAAAVCARLLPRGVVLARALHAALCRARLGHAGRQPARAGAHQTLLLGSWKSTHMRHGAGTTAWCCAVR